MKWLRSVLLLFLPVTSALALEPGDIAPEFSLINQHQQMESLADYRGQWVVVYFYPKNDTPGCTTEACSFRDNINGIIAKQATVFGISVDNVASHAAFAEKYQLPYSLLSDERGDVAKQYNSIWQLGPLRFARRNSFIVDPNGRIAKVYKGVDPEAHVADVLRDLSQLQQTAAQS
jgi:peroxiredoxin Q/BCP